MLLCFLRCACLFLAQGISLSFVHVLIIYTEDQAAQNDGKLSHPIYFLFEVSNARADQGFFDANAETLSRTGLAAALRNILISGPSKTTRAPMIVGPTNSGKSTLVLPFDTLFGFGRVFHKPALGSSFALRNILKEKRFLFWDDFRPVEYGQRTVPVTTFLSLFQHEPFEVQVSQSFNDGNALNGTTAACSLPKAKACGQQREVLTMKTSVI